MVTVAFLAKYKVPKKSVLSIKDISLPKKHDMGGQSSHRYQREYLNKRDAYVKTTCENAKTLFIDNDLPNVRSIIVAGSGLFKTQFSRCKHLDPRLRPVITKIVDISYGGVAGFEQAIEAVREDLAGLPLLKEKQVVSEFFELIKTCTLGEVSKVTVGPEETLAVLEAKVIETILIDENSQRLRHRKMVKPF